MAVYATGHYDDSTGRLLCFARDYGFGLTALDNKTLRLHPAAIVDSFSKSKLLKVIFSISVDDTAGECWAGVTDGSMGDSTTDNINSYIVVDHTESCFTAIPPFQLGASSEWATVRRTWRPKKMGFNHDQQLFITYDPQGVTTLEFGFQLSIYAEFYEV